MAVAIAAVVPYELVVMASAFVLVCVRRMSPFLVWRPLAEWSTS